MEFNTYRTNLQLCPDCGAEFSAVTGAVPGQSSPKAGDFTFCVYCKVLLRMADDNGRIRKAKPEERELLHPDQLELFENFQRMKHKDPSRPQ